VVLFTDAMPNIDAASTLPEAVNLKNADTLILTVAVGYPGHIDVNMLGQLTSEPIARNSFSINSYGRLWNFTDSIVGALCDSETFMISIAYGHKLCVKK
jgi:hypothetical protein